MFGKQPSKDELRQQLQAQCDHAMMLDNSIHTLYASQPTPSKPKYRPRKLEQDSFQQELDRLEQTKLASDTGAPQSGLEPSALGPDTGVDVDSLEREVAEFMRNRQRK